MSTPARQPERSQNWTMQGRPRRHQASLLQLPLFLCLVGACMFFQPATARSWWSRASQPPPPLAHAPGDCLNNVKQTVPFDDVVAPGRPLPNNSIPLAGHSWVGAASRRFFYEGYSSNFGLPDCKVAIRYKVVNKTVYVDAERVKRHPYPKGYMDNFNEMLILATWMYELPDMDLMVGPSDDPYRCDYPIMYFSYSSERPTYAIPHHRNWQEVGMSKTQLEAFITCLDHRYPQAERIPSVFWRGSSTGGALDSPHLAHDFMGGRLFFNKRSFAACMAQPYPFFDVAVYDIHKSSANTKEENDAAAYLKRLCGRSTVPLEEWARYAFTLYLQGNGFTDRTPLQMFLPSSMLYVAHPHIFEWFTPFLTQEMVQFVESDFSDFIHVGKLTVKDYKAHPGRYTQMVAKRRELAVRKFNLVAVMDAFVYVLMHVKSNCQWDVELTSEFEPVQHSRDWMNQVLPDTVKQAVMAARSANFVSVG